MPATELTDANFEGTIKQGNWIVDFYADWCAPCRTMSSIVEEIGAELNNKIQIGKLNVEENPKTAEKYGISSLPTFMFLENGKSIGSEIGSRPKEDFLALIKEKFKI